MKNRLYKVLSVVLSIAMLLSVCFVSGMVNAVAETTGEVRDYYVKYDGTEYANTDVYGTNGTVENPYKTVYDVVAAVKADATFDAAGNTFNVWVMQDIEAVANMNADVTVGSTTYATHNMVSWAKSGTTATMESHNAKMVVKPYASNPTGTETYLAFSTLAGAIEQFHIYGPTEFDNIKLVMTANDYTGNLVNGRINCNGNNVKFGSGVTYAYVSTAKSEAASWDGTITNIATITTDIVDVHDSDTAKVIEDAFEVEFENKINGVAGYTGFPTVKGDANYNFKNDVTIAITGAPFQGRLSLGGDGNKYASVLDKNLNLRLTGSTDTFQFAKNSSLIVKGGVQVIKSKSFKGSVVSYSDISGFNLYATEEKAAKAPIWYLNVDNSVKNYIDFIDGGTGKFQVPADAVAVATDAEGKTYTSDKKGVLDLSEKAGEYTVSITVKTYDYYVKGGATGTGMTEDDPAPSIATAVTNMVASGGLTAEDTANIWIMQDMTDITGTGAKNGGTHNMAYWGTLPAFTNTIHIKPHKDNTYTGNVTSTLLDMGNGNINKQSSATFTGDTIVEGVKFVRTSKSRIDKADEATLFFNGNNVTLGKGVTFAYINANGDTPHPAGSDKAGQNFSVAGWPTNLTYLLKEHMHFFTTTGVAGEEYSEPIKVVYNNDFHGAAVNQRLDVPASVTGTYTFKNDVTVEFGGAASQASLRLGTSASGATIKYESNLNFKFLKASNGLRLKKGSSKLLVKGGVQVLAETGFKLASNSDVASLDALGLLFKEDGTTPADIWNVNVVSNLDKIDFTSVAGVYKIADNCIATATNKTTGVTKDSVEGVLDLTELGVGTYDIAITVVRAKVYDYYVKAGGTGDGYSIDAPAPDVATAITTMNSLGLKANETATIHIMQNIDAITGTTSKKHNMASWNGFVEHDATVIIKPYSENTYSDAVPKTLIAFSSSLAHETTLQFGGPTIVNDIQLVATSSTRIGDQKINLNGENVTLGKGTTLGYLNINGNSYDKFATDPGDITSDLKNHFVNVWTSYDTEEKTYTEPVNLEFNQAYNTVSEGAIYVGDSVSTFKEDFTVRLNLTDAYNPRVQLGTTYASVFEKNLNFKLTEVREYFGFNNKTALTVDGGIQFIYDFDKVSFHKNNPPSDLGKLAVKSDGSKADVWIISVTSDYIDGVDFVAGETGKFTVKAPDGLVAIATKTVAEGETAIDPVAAVDGVLDLSKVPGEYEISFVEGHISDWSTIRVYKDMDLDLANEKHLWVDGKVFIGWKYRDSDEYPQTTDGVASLKAGDVLVADYMDMAESDFELTDIELRADGNENDPAIRYIINKNKAFEEKIGATEYGAIYLPADQAQGFEIFLDKEPVVSWYAYENEIYSNYNNEEWGVRKTTGYTPIQITADPEKVLEETETDLTYSVCLTEIPEEDYRTFYAVRGYMKFTDKNGIESAAYTTQEISSLYKEACDTVDTPLEERTDAHNDIIEKAEAQIEEGYLALKSSWKTPTETGQTISIAGKDITDEEAKERNSIIYTTDSYGKQYTRYITVDTGMDVEDTELLFVTDTHATYSNEKDIFSKYNNAIGYYKSRAYYGKDFNERSGYPQRAINSANMASLFDKVVLGGDMADYVSDGNYQAIKRIWSDRSINNGKSLKGTISMTPGNHEHSQSDATEEEYLDVDEIHAELDKVMSSVSSMDYDIVYDSNGKENYMVVTIDNSYVKYFKKQIEPLQACIDYARENNLPIILFQHVPMATGDEADAEFWSTAPEYLRFALGGRTPHPALYKDYLAWKEANPDATDSQKIKYVKDNLYPGDGETYPKGWELTNIYDGDGYTGHSASDETTLQVRQMITSSSDVIKAIVCGHNHSDYTTGVVTTDADGNKLKDEDGNYITIPQYTTTAGYQRGSMVINLK